MKSRVFAAGTAAVLCLLLAGNALARMLMGGTPWGLDPNAQPGVLVAGLPRANEVDRIAALQCAIHHFCDGPRHTVDFRRVGFGDYGDAQACVHARLS